MARTRQKAKQRKAKRLAQQRKAEQRGSGKTPETAKAAREQPVETPEQRLEEIEEEGVGRESMSGTGIAAEVELDQARMDAELQEAQAQAVDEAEVAGEAADSVVPVEEPRRQRRKRGQQAPAKPDKKAAKAERSKRDKDKRRQRQQGQKAKGQPRERGRVVKFLAQVWAELQRVQWPTRDQVLQATGVVFGFCAIAGLYLAFWDFIWNDVVKRVF